MPTPRTVERRPVDDRVDDQEAISFRGSSLEDAIAIAEQALGPRIRVVAANRIRRGGIGGFFASDLGVEVSVVLEDESIDEALERLVAESEVQDRTHWRGDRSQRSIPDQPERETIDEPSFLEPRITVPRFAEPRPRDEAVAMPADAAHPAERPAALLDAVSAAVMPRIGRPSVFETPRAVTPTAVAPTVETPVEAVPAAVPVEVVPTEVVSPHAVSPHAVSTGGLVRHRPTPPPSRRQVELAVAAADQLIERLALTPRVKRLTVKVVVRAGDRREVETEATWEAMS